jgi:hypothetical protein
LQRSAACLPPSSAQSAIYLNAWPECHPGRLPRSTEIQFRSVVLACGGKLQAYDLGRHEATLPNRNDARSACSPSRGQVTAMIKFISVTDREVEYACCTICTSNVMSPYLREVELPGSRTAAPNVTGSTVTSPSSSSNITHGHENRTASSKLTDERSRFAASVPRPK